MSDRDALLHAICENPAEDTPRLVFADWLDEHADIFPTPVAVRARAAFIRDDIGMSQRDAFDPLRLRWELIEKPQREAEPWVRGVIPLLMRDDKLAQPVFRRGFPWVAHTTPEEVMANGGRLRSTLPFTTLAITGKHAATETLFRSRHFAGLTGLRIADAFLWPQSVRVLAESPHAAALQELTSKGGLTHPAVTYLLRSPLFPRLTALDLGHAAGGFGPVFVAQLPPDPGPVRLRGLDLAESGLAGAAVGRLGEAAALQGLTRLSLAKCRLGLTGYDALTRADFPHLRDLDLSETMPGSEGVRLLWRWPGLARLHRLRFRLNHVNAELAAELTDRPEAVSLRTLDLNSNAIGNAGATAIASSPHLTNLRVLTLQNGMVGDEGVTAILESPLADQLAFLDLSVSPASAEMKEVLKARMGDRVRI